MLQSAAQVLTMVVITLPVLAIGYLLVRLVRQVSTATWQATADRPLRRILAGLTAVGILAALAWAWWPDAETYRPIEPTERGTLTDFVNAAAVSTGLARPAPVVGLQAGETRSVQAVWDTAEPLPTKAEPQLALVMVPKPGSPSRCAHLGVPVQQAARTRPG